MEKIFYYLGKEILVEKLKNVACICKCRKWSELTFEAREGADGKFWAMDNFNNQNVFLLTQVRSTIKVSARTTKECLKSRWKCMTRYL